MPTEKPQSRNEIVLPFEDAQRLVLEHAAGLHATNAKSAADATDAKIERVSLLQSRNRTLAEEVRADRDFPPFRRAARDGYAVRADDLKAFPELEVVGEIRAGGE